MHAELELRPASVVSEKIIQYCCKSSKAGFDLQKLVLTVF